MITLILICLVIWSFILIFIWKIYISNENLFSPISLYLYVNFIGVLLFFFYIFGKYEYSPPYIDLSVISPNCIFLSVISYTLLNAYVLLIMMIFKYKPLQVNEQYFENINFHRSLIISCLFYLILIVYFFKEIGLNISAGFLDIYIQLNKFRFLISRDFFAFSLLFINPMIYYLTMKLIYHRDKIPYYYYPATIIVVIYLILQNARGLFVFPVIFALSLKKNLSFRKMIADFGRLAININIVKVTLFLMIMLFIFHFYTVYLRNQRVNFLESLLHRIDNFYASALVCEYDLINFKPEKILYPVLYIIPRRFYEDKPFPPNGELSRDILGAALLAENPYENVEAWSVNFGSAGESAYVGYGFLLIPIQAFSIVISALYYNNIVRELSKNGKLTYLKFVLLVYLYTYPFSVIMGGVLAPVTGNLIIIGISIFLWQNLILVLRKATSKGVRP